MPFGLMPGGAPGGVLSPAIEDGGKASPASQGEKRLREQVVLVQHPAGELEELVLGLIPLGGEGDQRARDIHGFLKADRPGHQPGPGEGRVGQTGR